MLHSWPGKLPEMCDASGEAPMAHGGWFLTKVFVALPLGLWIHKDRIFSI